MYRGRFAPSPTGSLHFGSLVAAVGSWLFARAAGGAWIVRMEDLDHEREVAGAAERILATLAAFGLVSDEPVLFQSTRNDAYAAALARLDAAGHTYRCWCTRRDLEPFGGIHPDICIAGESDRTPAWRVRIQDAVISLDDGIQGTVIQDLRREVGDFVVWRVEGGCAYQLAVVVDDDEQAINAIVRGADLLDSTPRQILLQRLFGFARPRYAHLPLVLGTDGRKLSKHEAAMPVDGRDPLPALSAALTFLGQPLAFGRDPAALLARAVQCFDARAIPRTGEAHRSIAAVRKET
ncbi:MAG: tRNA glutamyl-Q(34) synthetase GluQRS [Dokdonella sp.]